MNIIDIFDNLIERVHKKRVEINESRDEKAGNMHEWLEIGGQIDGIDMAMDVMRAERAEVEKIAPHFVELWMFVKRQQWPRIFEAMEKISHDRGTSAGHKGYWVPSRWLPHFNEIEDALKILSDEQLETLTIGEQSEAEAVIGSLPRLIIANRFLNEFFDEFCDDINEDNDNGTRTGTMDCLGA